MSLKEIILQEISLYLEGKAEDLVAKFPELQPAYDAGIKNPQYLQWIQKRRGGEPVEDIIGVVQSFDAAKQRLKAKKMSPDIYAYKTPATLRQALEDLGGSKGQERRRLKDEETTYLGEFGNWVVVMPHTRESSCQFGKGTTWCTAATQSQNLFLSYVARKEEDIVLYYIIKKGEDPRIDPEAKLSVGFINGEPVLDGEYGGISVDAQNDGLDEDRLSQILGYQFEPIMDAMRENASSIGGKHPAKKQMEKIVKNPVAFEKAIANMGKEEKRDFVRNAFDYDVSPKTLVKLADDEDEDIKTMVARNPSTPPEVLVKLSMDSFPRPRHAVAANPSTPPEGLFNLAGDQSFWVRETVVKNRNAPPELLAKLSGDQDLRIRRLVAENPSTPIEVLAKLSKDKQSDVRQNVAANPSTPIEVLTKFNKDVEENREYRGVAISLAVNPALPPKMLEKLSRNVDSSIRARVAANPNTPPEVLATLFGDNAHSVMRELAENPNTPPEVLAKFKARKLDKFYPALAINPSTPIEILIYLSKLYPWDDWLVKILNNNPTYVAYKKEQGLNESQIKELAREELKLFLEGKAEDLVSKFPELQPAYDAGIKNPQYLQWIQKRRGGEPVEDIIGVVQAFDKSKQRLKAKKMSPDIYAYKTPATLRQALEDLGGSKGQERRRLKDEETTYLGEFGDWVVAMPHTRESSCQLGKGTTWCTAATQSQNLFLSYVAKKEEDIVLYYIIKKGVDPRQEPTAKLSVGFINGEPVLDDRYGGVTVDAQNNGLDENKLSQILGAQFEPIMKAMRENAGSIEGKHPAKKQMEKIAKDPVAFEKAIQNMGEEERRDFVRSALEYEVSPKILVKLVEDDDAGIREDVAGNPFTPPEMLVKLSNDKDSMVKAEVGANPAAPPEVLTKLASAYNGRNYSTIAMNVAGNPSTPPEVLVGLSKSIHSYMRKAIARNTSTPPEVLDMLSDDSNRDVRATVANHPSAPPEVLVKLSKDEEGRIRERVALNPSSPPEALVILSKDDVRSIRSYTASNPSLPPKMLVNFAEDGYWGIRAGVARNPAAPPEVLFKLSKDRDFHVRMGVASNPSTPTKALLKLAADSLDYVKSKVARNPTYVAYKKKQEMNESQIKELAREELKLFLEGKAEDLVSKFPELQPAYDAGIKNPQYLQWIQRRRGGEPVEDIVGVVQVFDKSKQRLKAKKMSPDIYAYKTPATLRQALEDLGGSKGEERRRLKDEETTHIGTFGDWDVVMPHSKESSCQLGKDTTWCTAATQSGNLFYSYVARPDQNITLYYVIKKGAQARKNPEEKLSVGFINGEPVLNGQGGGLTVDAANAGLDRNKFKQILGDQAEPALQAMKAHSDSIGGKHPAKKKLEEMARDLEKFRQHISPMKRDEKADFLYLIIPLKPSLEIIREIIKESQKLNFTDHSKIARQISDQIKDSATLVDIAKTDLDAIDPRQSFYAANALSSPFIDQTFVGEVIDKIIKKELSSRFLISVNQNRNLSSENITKIIEHYSKRRHGRYMNSMAKQYNLQPSHIENIIDIITYLLEKPIESHLDYDRRRRAEDTALSLASNLSVPTEYLLKLYNINWPRGREKINDKLSLNPNFPEELVYKIRPDLKPDQRKYSMWYYHDQHPLYKDIPQHLKHTPPREQVNEWTTYNEGTTMQFTEEYIKQVIREEYEAVLDEKKKKPCKPAKGKRFAKRVNGKCRSYGQAGKAKGGGDRIRPGTKKGDAYCARSAKIKKCKNPPCANDLSRKKWKCRGSKSMK